jgi:hypothetical protein
MKETPMETTVGRGILELDHRSGDGIDVGLYWERWADCTYLVLVDERTHECFRVEVEASSASDAFEHPFVYVRDSDAVVPALLGR